MFSLLISVLLACAHRLESGFIFASFMFRGPGVSIVFFFGLLVGATVANAVIKLIDGSGWGRESWKLTVLQYNGDMYGIFVKDEPFVLIDVVEEVNGCIS